MQGIGYLESHSRLLGEGRAVAWPQPPASSRLLHCQPSIALPRGTHPRALGDVSSSSSPSRFSVWGCDS